MKLGIVRFAEVNLTMPVSYLCSRAYLAVVFYTNWLASIPAKNHHKYSTLLSIKESNERSSFSRKISPDCG